MNLRIFFTNMDITHQRQQIENQPEYETSATALKNWGDTISGLVTDFEILNGTALTGEDRTAKFQHRLEELGLSPEEYEERLDNLTNPGVAIAEIMSPITNDIGIAQLIKHQWDSISHPDSFNEHKENFSKAVQAFSKLQLPKGDAEKLVLELVHNCTTFEKIMMHGTYGNTRYEEEIEEGMAGLINGAPEEERNAIRDALSSHYVTHDVITKIENKRLGQTKNDL